MEDGVGLGDTKGHWDLRYGFVKELSYNTRANGENKSKVIAEKKMLGPIHDGLRIREQVSREIYDTS